MTHEPPSEFEGLPSIRLDNGQEWEVRLIGAPYMAPVDQLLHNPNNYKVHPDRQREALAVAFETVGWLYPILHNIRTGHILDGHGRAEVAAERGAANVPLQDVDIPASLESIVLATLDPIGRLGYVDQGKARESYMVARSAALELDSDKLNTLLDETRALEIGVTRYAPNDAGAGAATRGDGPRIRSPALSSDVEIVVTCRRDLVDEILTVLEEWDGEGVQVNIND